MEYDLELEKDILSYVINNPITLADCDSIKEEHFSEQEHRAIWSALNELKTGWSLRLLKSKTHGKHDDLLDDLKTRTVTGDLVHACTILRSMAVRRQIMLAAGELATISKKPEKDVTSLLSKVDGIIDNIRNMYIQDTDQKDLSYYIDQLRKFRTERRNNTDQGLQWGYRELTRLLGEIQPSDLTLIAGRPSHGKTTLAFNIAYKIASKDVPIGFFSLEMSPEQITYKIYGKVSGIPTIDFERDNVSEDDWEFAEDHAKDYTDFFLINDKPHTIEDLFMWARRLVNLYGVKIIFVDYIQLMYSSRKTGSRVQEMTEISIQLKKIAKVLKIPVVALSQLSRQCEQREDKRPMLSDLRETGQLEQDADNVLFIYDPTKYDKELTNRGIHDIEVIVAKQRRGPTDTVMLTFDPELGSYNEG